MLFSSSLDRWIGGISRKESKNRVLHSVEKYKTNYQNCAKQCSRIERQAREAFSLVSSNQSYGLTVSRINNEMLTEISSRMFLDKTRKTKDSSSEIVMHFIPERLSMQPQVAS